MQPNRTWDGIPNERNDNGIGVGESTTRDGRGRSCGKAISQIDVGAARERRTILLHGSSDYSAAPPGSYVIRERAKANISGGRDQLHAASGKASRGRRG